MYTEGIQGEFLWNAGVYLGSGAILQLPFTVLT
jgi:hypothetical protein